MRHERRELAAYPRWCATLMPAARMRPGPPAPLLRGRAIPR